MQQLLRTLISFLIFLTCHATEPLRICTEDVPAPPWTAPSLTGLAFDVLHDAETSLGEHFVYLIKPWSRCMAEIKAGQFDAVLGAALSRERQTYCVFPTLSDGREDAAAALFQDQFFVFIRRESDASWDGKNFTVKRPIIVQRGYVAVEWLTEKGYPIAPITKTGKDGLRMLADGMADVAVIMGVDNARFAKTDPDLSSRIQTSPILYANLPFHLMVSKQAYEKDPKRIEALWRTIKAIRASEAYRQREKDVLGENTYKAPSTAQESH